jgi:hypothetical protein
MTEKSVKLIVRKCLVCGKKLKIKLYEGGSYKGGEYFGKLRPALKIAKKPLKYTTILGRRCPVTRVLKYGKEVEYWECKNCYNEP